MNLFRCFRRDSISKTCLHRPPWFEDLRGLRAMGQGGVPGQPPTHPEKNPAEPPCLMGEGVGRQPPPLRLDPSRPSSFLGSPRVRALRQRSCAGEYPGPVHCCVVLISGQGGPRPTPHPSGKKSGQTPLPHGGGGRPATPLPYRAGIRMPAGVLPVSGFRAMAEGEGGLAVNPPGNLKKPPLRKNAAGGFSGLFLLLPEGVVRIDNRDKRTREHRDQDEPDGKVRDQRAGTAHDTGNLE